MARQNVGTPRFYINIYEYLESIGAISIPDGRSYLRTNPTKTHIQKFANDNDGDNDTTILPDCPIAWGDLAGDKGFVALLGHNMASCNSQVALQEGTSDYTVMGNITEVVNSAKIDNHPSPEYDGFTIWSGDFSDFDQLGGSDSEKTMQFRWESGQNWGEPDDNPYNGIDLICNSIVIGSYYDMPHSPDLNLKLRYEYDGVKTIQTKSGATISNALYTKPADWGSQGAWQLGGKQNYRTGRRTWDLSFSYLSADGIMPLNSSASYISTIGSESGYPDGSIVQSAGLDTPDDSSDDTYSFISNILTGTDFFSQVWNRTIGGALPFIFQPDNNNNNPDQFAICKFAQNSLNYEQVAPNVYNIKLKIEEVW